jgi:hypothetical protein
LEARKLEIEVAIQHIKRKIELENAEEREKTKNAAVAAMKTKAPLKSNIKLNNTEKQNLVVTSPGKGNEEPLMSSDPRTNTPNKINMNSVKSTASSRLNKTSGSPAVATPSTPQKTAAQTSRQKSLALEEERRKRIKAEKQLQMHKATVLTLQSKIEDLQVEKEQQNGIIFEQTTGPLFERIESKQKLAANNQDNISSQYKIDEVCLNNAMYDCLYFLLLLLI